MEPPVSASWPGTGGSPPTDTSALPAPLLRHRVARLNAIESRTASVGIASRYPAGIRSAGRAVAPRQSSAASTARRGTIRALSDRR
jgi:hypothetical protein